MESLPGDIEATPLRADIRARARFGGLWRHRDFMRLWAGQTISKLGSQIGGGAFGLIAILMLSATPVQMGLLAAAQSLPMLLLGLPAGVWVDRLSRLFLGHYISFKEEKYAPRSKQVLVTRTGDWSCTRENTTVFVEFGYSCFRAI